VKRFTCTFPQVIEESLVPDLAAPTVIAVLAEALPEGRTLTISECAHAAEAAAAVYDLDALVDFERGERTYTQLWRTEHSEAYAIGWKQAGDTGFHDHDGSVGSVHVVRGTVAEEHIVLRPAGDWLARVEFAAGETFRFDGAHIHRTRPVRPRSRCTSTRPRSAAPAPTSSPGTARSGATASAAPRSYGSATPSRSTARSRTRPPARSRACRSRHVGSRGRRVARAEQRRVRVPRKRSRVRLARRRDARQGVARTPLALAASPYRRRS
jgi:hypothetical protein